MGHTQRDQEALLRRVRKLRGQVDSVERALLEELPCSDVLHRVSACRGAVSSLLAFKNTTGEFAKRRMIRGIKDFHQVGRGPIDDISFAVVRIEQVIDLAEEV